MKIRKFLIGRTLKKLLKQATKLTGLTERKARTEGDEISKEFAGKKLQSDSETTRNSIHHSHVNCFAHQESAVLTLEFNSSQPCQLDVLTLEFNPLTLCQNVLKSIQCLELLPLK